MARQESDREDLMVEATGLWDRAALRLDSCAEPLVIGFRRNSAVSLFVGQDEVFQFNSDQRLRRAYWRGELIKAQGGQLIALRRHRQTGQTILASRPFGERETEQFLRRMRARLDELQMALRESSYEVSDVVSSTGNDVIARVQQWLQRLPDAIEVAHSPRVGR